MGMFDNGGIMDDNEELLKKAKALEDEIEEASRQPQSIEDIAYERALNLCFLQQMAYYANKDLTKKQAKALEKEEKKIGRQLRDIFRRLAKAPEKSAVNNGDV